MPHRRYVIRNFRATGASHRIDEMSVAGLAEAKYAAEQQAYHCLGAHVLDPDRFIVARFGNAPDVG